MTLQTLSLTGVVSAFAFALVAVFCLWQGADPWIAAPVFVVQAVCFKYQLGAYKRARAEDR